MAVPTPEKVRTIPAAPVVEPVRDAISLSAPPLLQQPEKLPPLDPVYPLPRIYRTVFRDATVFSGGVVLTRDARLPKDLCPDLNTPPDWHRACELRRLPQAVRKEGDITVIAALGGGYYHWVLDSLPRLDFLPGPPTGTILIENDQSFQREYLSIAGIPPERILSPTAWSHFAPDRLIVPSLPGISGRPPPESVAFLRQLRDRALGVPAAAGRRRRLYLTRSGTGNRCVANESELRTRLSLHGFEPINAGAMGVKEQMAAFTAAEIVVGAHGGALANLAYCLPGTPVIELTPASYVNPCFRLLCWSAGLVYGCLVCPCAATRFDARASTEKNYIVPLDLLDELVNRGLRRRPEVRDQRSEVRDQRSEVRDQRSEVRDQRSER